VYSLCVLNANYEFIVFLPPIGCNDKGINKLTL